MLLTAISCCLMQNNPAEAVEWLDDMKVTNEQFKEHLIDLCMDKKLTATLTNISTQQKTAFTKDYNKSHGNKDGFTTTKKSKISK